MWEDPVCRKLKKGLCEGKKPCIRWNDHGQLRQKIKFKDCPNFEE